mgnify:CR=1 FL=1
MVGVRGFLEVRLEDGELVEGIVNSERVGESNDSEKRDSRKNFLNEPTGSVR